jgi:4-hydroxy 2-oxovalerate aldolase
MTVTEQSEPLRPVLLDCTLRDGGNQNNWQFTERDVTTIVSTLDEAGIDIIEVGYRGGSGSADTTTAGASAHCDPAYLAALPEVRNAELAVMVVPTVCPLDALDDLADSPIGLVRIASYPWNFDAVPAYVAAVRRLGLRVGVNLMAVSYVDLDELETLAKTIAADEPDVLCVADSFGALTPEDVTARFEVLRGVLGCRIGLHGHNNLGLAAANALAALGAGATTLDASLCAMARGAGNLATEQAAAFLTASARYACTADPAVLGRAARYVAEQVLPRPMPLTAVEIAAGLNDHHYYFVPHIEAAAAEHGLDAWEIGRRLGLARPRKVRAEQVEAVCQEMIEERT